ncbi:MAG: histidine phosphatase family protein [Chloroflexi bacterium]|nr:histidine phosphatase family protein [Chloroflexota bacterium]
MTELVLIRHGNAKKLQGETYVTAPLTELGRRQAELTGEFLKHAGARFDGFYSSPLKRAFETATIIGAHIGQTPIVRNGIQEMEYREIPLTVALELFARTRVLDRYFETHAGKVVRHPLMGRVSRVLVELVCAHPQGRVALVVHGGVILSVLAWYFPRERRHWWRAAVGNCSITRLEISAGQPTLLAFDELAHLGELQPSAHQANYSFSAQRGL